MKVSLLHLKRPDRRSRRECRTSSEEAGSSVAKVEYVAYPKVSIAEALDIQEEKHTGTGVLALLPPSVYSTDDAHAWRGQFGDYPPSSIGKFDELINDLTDALSEIVVDDLSFAAESVQEKFRSFSHKYNSVLQESLEKSAQFKEDGCQSSPCTSQWPKRPAAAVGTKRKLPTATP